jgi:hypothetical protein
MWLAAGLAVAWLEREDFQTIQDVLSRPDPAVAERVKVLGAHETYLLMGHVAAEQRQRTIRNWEDVQLVLGLGFFFYLLFGTREGKWSLALALLLVGMVLLERFLLTPEALSLARIAGLAHSHAASGEDVRRMVLNSTHMGFEIAKWIVELSLAAMMVVGRGGRSGDAGDQFDVIDKPNHSRVNR